MLTPNGRPANKIEKVMLLSMWANSLAEEQGLAPKKKLIFAGLGKPTYPINKNIIMSNLSYWQRLDDLTKKWFVNPDQMDECAAIDYGDPRGDRESVALMAEAMSTWYESEIKPEHVLFTVGGIGGLHVIFETLNTLYEDIPNYRLITPFPHYSAYLNNPNQLLHPIDVMKEPGYKLTAQNMEESIQQAYSLAKLDNGWPKAILICNPSNPLGTIIDEVELKKIAECLRNHPDLHIIFDEAYAEMSYVEMPSFLKIAPDLNNRTVILRSATKGFSAAGERMAILLAFNQELMNEMLNKKISHYLHSPRSGQMAYAYTMANFDAVERKNLITFYKYKVDYVIKRLHAMGAAMPDQMYRVEATFYALGDFSDLFGMKLPNEAQRALEKTGTITTDEELAYYLLFKDLLMIAPLAYFGLQKNSGFVRITCSGNKNELQELMNRLEQRLFDARTRIKSRLIKQINRGLIHLKDIDSSMFEEIYQKIIFLDKANSCCLELKSTNLELKKLGSAMMAKIG